MGMLEDVFEHSLPGVVIGALASAIILPMVGGRAASPGANGRRRANPLMRAAVRGYVNVSDRIKEYTAETREKLQDLAAEAREERRMDAESAAAPEATASTASSPGPGTAPSPGPA